MHFIVKNYAFKVLYMRVFDIKNNKHHAQYYAHSNAHSKKGNNIHSNTVICYN